MRTTNKFKEICSYQSSNFREWFADMEYPEDGVGAILYNKKLPRRMNDSEILTELKPTEVTIYDIYDTLKTLDKSVWGIFYCKDVTGVLRSVFVDWDGGGWFVCADDVEDPVQWSDGRQVFSRNSFYQPISSSDEIKKINDKLDLILKTIK